MVHLLHAELRVSGQLLGPVSDWIALDDLVGMDEEEGDEEEGYEVEGDEEEGDEEEGDEEDAEEGEDLVAPITPPPTDE